MILHFLRTGEKRYSIEIERDGFPTLEMNPAPGYDPQVPHDMMHLVVEAVLGLDRAVFGQIAAGGDAGTFHVKQGSGASKRDASRERKRQKIRGEKIRAGETDHFARSERATHVVWQEWLSRSNVKSDKNKAISMKEQADQLRQMMSGSERRSIDDSIERMCRHLDEISAEWSGLSVGGRMTIRWPDLKLLDG